MTDIQRTRLRKLASNHVVRIREYTYDRIVAILCSSPAKQEYSVYTISASGLSTDFIFFCSKMYEPTFKALPTLAQFERRSA